MSFSSSMTLEKMSCEEKDPWDEGKWWWQFEFRVYYIFHSHLSEHYYSQYPGKLHTLENSPKNNRNSIFHLKKISQRIKADIFSRNVINWRYKLNIYLNSNFRMFSRQQSNACLVALIVFYRRKRDIQQSLEENTWHSHHNT